MKIKLSPRLVGVTLLLISLLLHTGRALAQAAGAPEMADRLRASGKIYVVVAVVVIIVSGLLAYLVLLDRKVRRLEQEIKK